jgi:hypothetical protein
MKKWYALVALGITGAGIASFCATPRHRSAEVSRRLHIAAETEPVALAPPALGDNARPRLAPRAMLPVAAEPTPSPPVPRAAESERDDEPSHARRTEPSMIGARLEEHVAQERHDPAWSTDAQRTAGARLVGTIPETSELRSIECRASMCRIETVHQDIDHYQPFVYRAFMNQETHLWNGGFFATLLGDPAKDKVTTVAYLARDGEALPSIPDAP